MKILRGIAGSDGIAIGNAHVLDRRAVTTPKYHLSPGEVEAEVTRFRRAVESTDQQFQRIRERLSAMGVGDHALIIQAHQLMLRDASLTEATVRRIEEEQLNAEWALEETVQRIKRLFDELENDYFRERRSDVGFVADHVMHAMLGSTQPDPGPPAEAVVVSSDLSPADAARLYRYQIKAFVTDRGSRTSHTAIVARSQGIPAVLGLKEATALVRNGDVVIVDGRRGKLIIDPDEATLDRYRQRVEERARRALALSSERDLPAVTLDGTRVSLIANLELPEELPVALGQGAEGVGLYRTEFLYLGRDQAPTEEDHYADARRVLELAGGRQVTFRTLDLAGDKLPGGVAGPPEPNPALGLSSIRLCLEQRELFTRQLRGILRAARHGPLRLMFPMIAGLEEFRLARGIAEQCRRDLADEGVDVPEVPLGAMVELPSAALTCDLIAREADFLSVGTNDLTQYTLAIDRGNQQVAHLFCSFHPAVLRLLRAAVQGASQHGVPLAVCGEMAGDPLMTQLLVGLGVRTLSMTGLALPQIRRVVRGTSLKEAQDVALRALEGATPAEVETVLKGGLDGTFPQHSYAVFNDWDDDTVA